MMSYHDGETLYYVIDLKNESEQKVVIDRKDAWKKYEELRSKDPTAKLRVVRSYLLQDF